jgi:hypothetical protein
MQFARRQEAPAFGECEGAGWRGELPASAPTGAILNAGPTMSGHDQAFALNTATQVLDETPLARGVR